MEKLIAVNHELIKDGRVATRGKNWLKPGSLKISARKFFNPK